MNKSFFTTLLFASLLSSNPLFSHGDKNDHPHTPGDVSKLENYEILGHGSLKYKVYKDWGKLDKNKYPIKNCHAMVQKKDGDFIALCDDNKHNFLLYAPDGTLKNAWMKEFPGAHGLEIFEENGKEMLIVVDGGWAVRQGKQYKETGRVAKTDINGQLVFGFGHPQTVGAYKPGQKFMPCDAAVAPNGDIYISDGYGSQYVLQYDQHGRFIRKFGGKSDPDKRAHLSGAHGISIDNRDPKNIKLIVSSRSSNQLKFFTLDGKFLETVDLPGAYGGQAVVHNGHLYVGACWSKQNGTGKRLSNSGFVVILNEKNKVVSCPGGSEPKYVDGKLQPMYQTEKTFLHVHDLCVDRDGNIFVVQWNAAGAYPIKLELLP